MPLGNSIVDARVLRFILSRSGLEYSEKSYKQSQIICRRGDPAKDMFFVKEGTVEVEVGSKKKEKKYILHEAMFGEVGVLSEKGVRTATCKAHTDVVLVCLAADQVQLLTKNFPEYGNCVKKRALSIVDGSDETDNEVFKDILKLHPLTNSLEFVHNHSIGERLAADISESVFDSPLAKSAREEVPLGSLDLDTLSLSDEQMLCLLEVMFERLHLIEELQMERKKLRRFLLLFRLHCRTNPYHNFQHMFTVAQMVFSVISAPPVSEKVEKLEKMAVLISAICHDLDHPGLTNSFQSNSQSKLTSKFSSSFLENHHASLLWELLLIPEADFLNCLSAEDYMYVRKTINECILATDMAQHNKIVESCKSRLANFDMTNKEHSRLFLLLVLKLADIANESRPFSISSKWAKNLVEENGAQYTLETTLKLPKAEYMNPARIDLAKVQVFFIDSFLLPLARVVAELEPKLEFILERVTKNRTIWMSKSEKEPEIGSP